MRRLLFAFALVCLPAGMLFAAKRPAIEQGDTTLLGRRTFAKNADATAKFRKFRDEDAPKARYLSMKAKKRSVDAEMFLEAPLDLGGSFRVEVEVGLFKLKLLDNLAGAFFGIEVRNDDDESEFYATYAEYDAASEGLNVFAMTAGGQVGPAVNFANATRLDLAIESDGSTLTFQARRPSSFGPGVGFLTIATAPQATANATFRGCVGATGFDKKAEVGAANLVLVHNDGPQIVSKGPSSEARQRFFAGCGWVLQTGRVLNRTTYSDLTLQQVAFTLDQARSHWQDARNKVELLDIPERKAALRQIDRAMDEAGYAESVIFRKKERGVKTARKVLHEHIWSAAFQIARLLPED